MCENDLLPASSSVGMNSFTLRDRASVRRLRDGASGFQRAASRRDGWMAKHASDAFVASNITANGARRPEQQQRTYYSEQLDPGTTTAHTTVTHLALSPSVLGTFVSSQVTMLPAERRSLQGE
jgi:hypothetical protein